MGTTTFETVHTIRDLYDGIRSGTADFGGAPHYFKSLFNSALDDYSEDFRLYPVTSEFMEHELRHWNIYRVWEAKFHRGLAPLETHPGHGGIDPSYDQLGDWLDARIASLTPITPLYTATFRVVPGQDDLPPGILAQTEVAWAPARTRSTD